MTSVERIQEYASLEQEAPDKAVLGPPPDWPRRGSIEFENVYLRYNKCDYPALKKVNFSIKPKEKVGE